MFSPWRRSSKWISHVHNASCKKLRGPKGDTDRLLQTGLENAGKTSEAQNVHFMNDRIIKALQEVNQNTRESKLKNSAQDVKQWQIKVVTIKVDEEH